MCVHENETVLCDGSQHVVVCQDCDAELRTEDCPEAGTWVDNERTED